MEIENDLIVDIWEIVKGYCSAKKRDELAHRLLHVFEDHGADGSKYNQLFGEDFHLDNAVEEWLEEHEEDLNENHDGEYFEEDDCH